MEGEAAGRLRLMRFQSSLKTISEVSLFAHGRDKATTVVVRVAALPRRARARAQLLLLCAALEGAAAWPDYSLVDASAMGASGVGVIYRLRAAQGRKPGSG